MTNNKYVYCVWSYDHLKAVGETPDDSLLAVCYTREVAEAWVKNFDETYDEALNYITKEYLLDAV